jgi:TrmH family RNA methyltransferase
VTDGPPPPRISSPGNPRIKAAGALRDRRARTSSGLTLIDGARELRRALDAGIPIVEAFIVESRLAGPDARAALDGLQAAGTDVVPVSDAALARLAFGDRNEGIVAVARFGAKALDEIPLGPDPLIVVIEDVEKPGNVGAVLRSADGAGADAVIAAAAGTDLANPNVIRASAGTVFSVPSAAADPAAVIAWLAARGIRTVAARVDADRPYTEVDLTGPLAIALGSEAEGLGEAWDVPGIEAIRLPMLGVADSLNVSVSAAILLYEARRQRDAARAGTRRSKPTGTPRS